MRTKSIAKLVNSIRGRLIIFSLLLLTIPLIIVSVFAYNKSVDNLNKLGEDNLKTAVKFTLELVSAFDGGVKKGHLPLEDAQEQVKVAILGELQADGTRPINRNLNLGENGYINIIDSTGYEVAHPTIEGQNAYDLEDVKGLKMVQEFIKAGDRGGDFVYYHWGMPDDPNKIEQKIAYIEKFEPWDWYIVASTYLYDFNQPAKDTFNFLSFVVVGITALGVIVVLLIAGSLSKPIVKIEEYMGELANGNLSQEFVEHSKVEEIHNLSKGSNALRDSLRNVVNNVLSAVGQIKSTSETLSHHSVEVKQGSEQIATTMQELAEGAERQANHATSISETMHQFISNVEEASRRGVGIRDLSQEVLESSNEGESLVVETRNQIKVLFETIQEAVGRVETLENRSNKITELVDIIRDIANQTNLLALNAAIEAARAGESGKGFAVVADEVRKLAEEVAKSVEDIETIVSNMQTESKVVTEHLRETYREAEISDQRVEETRDKFNEISERVNRMVIYSQDISERLNNILAESNKMGGSIEEIAAISEQSAAGVQQTSASAQQSTASLDEVLSKVNELNDLADDLNQIVSRFKV